MRPRSLLAAGVVLAAASAGFVSCQPLTFTGCEREAWVKGQVIQTHSWPVPDITAVEVRNRAAWTSWGYTPSCVGFSVNNMRGTGNDYWGGGGYCYWNPSQSGSRVTLCQGYGAGTDKEWVSHNVKAYVAWDDGSYQLWTTIYAATNRTYSMSCSVRHGSIPSGSRFACPSAVLR